MASPRAADSAVLRAPACPELMGLGSRRTRESWAHSGGRSARSWASTGSGPATHSSHKS
jgi:hypothetical protein